MSDWKAYQEEVADYFRTLGLTAETDVTLTGARTTHDIDVVVRSSHVGFDVLWLVECKAWKARVPKEKVLALRSIVDDLGADKGFVMAESGYQSGALESAQLTNVTLSSLADLQEMHAYELGITRLRKLPERVSRASERYWQLPKPHRIEHDLRPPVGVFGYSARRVLDAVDATVVAALINTTFPVVYDEWARSAWPSGDVWRVVEPSERSFVAETPAELFDYLAAELLEVERRLDLAEVAISGGAATNDHREEG